MSQACPQNTLIPRPAFTRSLPYQVVPRRNLAKSPCRPQTLLTLPAPTSELYSQRQTSNRSQGRTLDSSV
ncbi:hypothetical protein LX36DRAFT_662398 [Colletotrichum falcatum]|nr:hypothetical protein LX36DRAFT_662398 [Colletotrichum falcatum]